MTPGEEAMASPGEHRENGERVTLRDGAGILIRSLRPEDRELYLEGWERMSPQSRYRRFLSPKGSLSERELTFFTAVDHHDHEALGALDCESGEGVGVARFLREHHDSDVAEAAVAVVDPWQGRGVGTALLRRLSQRAREEGVNHFEATLLTENRSMLHVFEQVGCVKERRYGETSELNVELPTDEGRLEPLIETLKGAAKGLVRR